MQIRTLGSSGGMHPDSHTSSFLLDTDTLIDAGSGLLDLSLEEQYHISQIFITHAHFDHIVGLPLLVDNVMAWRTQKGLGPLKIHAREEVLTILHQCIFNNHIWPDFVRLPSAQTPVIQLCPLNVGHTIALPDYRRVEAVSAVHSVPATGYAIIQSLPGSSQRAWIYSGDTGRNPLLWQRINAMQDEGIRVQWLVMETSFCNSEQAFADLTGHLTPQALAGELQQLEHGDIDIYLTHMKPSEVGIILGELHELRQAAQSKNCRIHVIPPGHVFGRPTASMHMG